MSNSINKPAAMKPSNTKQVRLVQFGITSLLIGGLLVSGFVIATMVVVRLLLPVAATGFSTTVVGLSSASAHATISALQAGDSETRFAVLTQLEDTLNSQPPETIDPQVATWLKPALVECQTDSDPEVVRLATELLEFMAAHASEPPQQVGNTGQGNRDE